jgi:hypothetical protein
MRRVRVRARRPRRGEAGGSCWSSRLGGGAWVRPLGYKTPLYSSDDLCELNWRAASGAVRSCAKLVFEYCSSSTSCRVKFVVCEHIIQASGSVSLSVRLCVDCAQIPGR